MLKSLRRVPQRDWDNGDCGLACVAMVAGVSYEQALEAFRTLDRKGKTNKFYTKHCHVSKMLGHLGLSTKRIRFQSWREIEHHSIVKVNVKKSGTWHWVVFDAGRTYPAVHDPKPGKRKIVRDFRGLKGSGEYIAVTA